MKLYINHLEYLKYVKLYDKIEIFIIILSLFFNCIFIRAEHTSKLPLFCITFKCNLESVIFS